MGVIPKLDKGSSQQIPWWLLYTAYMFRNFLVLRSLIEVFPFQYDMAEDQDAE